MIHYSAFTTVHYQSTVSMISFAQVWTAQWSDTIPSRNVWFSIGIHLTLFRFNRYSIYRHCMLLSHDPIHPCLLPCRICLGFPTHSQLLPGSLADLRLLQCAHDTCISGKLGLICKPCIEIRTSQKHDIVVGIIWVHNILSVLHIIGCMHNFVSIHPIILQNDGV